MSYTDDTLTRDEKVLLRAKIALRRYWFNFLLGGICLVGVPISIVMMISGTGMIGPDISMGITDLLLGSLFLAPPFIRRWTNELVLTNKRVVSKSGLISLRTTELRLEKVESVNVTQGLWGKMLSYGTIEVTGTGATHAIIKGISDPVNFRKYFGRAAEGAV